MKCMKSLVKLTQMDRVRNEEVHRRARIERELASRVDPRQLDTSHPTSMHMERMNEYCTVCTATKVV